MATLFANRPRSPACLAADAIAPWLDRIGLPLVLAGAVVTMALALV